MAHCVEHDTIAVVERVHRMEDVTGIDVEPLHVVVAAVARHHTDACGIRRVPLVREAPGHREVEVEHAGQVEHDDVPLGQTHVVEHRRARRLDRDDLGDLARRVDDDVLHLVAEAPPVADRVQLARLRVALRMRREPVRQRAVEVTAPQRLELVAQLDRPTAGLDDRERLARVADHVRVRGEVHVAVDRATGVGHMQLGEHLARAHPAVAVPVGLAVGEADAVHHAFAAEPVVGRRVDGTDGVRPVAQEAAVQGRGDRARDGQIGRGHLFGDRSEVAFQVAVLDDGHAQPPEIV